MTQTQPLSQPESRLEFISDAHVARILTQTQARQIEILRTKFQTDRDQLDALVARKLVERADAPEIRRLALDRLVVGKDGPGGEALRWLQDNSSSYVLRGIITHEILARSESSPSGGFFSIGTTNWRYSARPPFHLDPGPNYQYLRTPEHLSNYENWIAIDAKTPRRWPTGDTGNWETINKAARAVKASSEDDTNCLKEIWTDDEYRANIAWETKTQEILNGLLAESVDLYLATHDKQLKGDSDDIVNEALSNWRSKFKEFLLAAVQDEEAPSEMRNMSLPHLLRLVWAPVECSVNVEPEYVSDILALCEDDISWMNDQTVSALQGFIRLLEERRLDRYPCREFELWQTPHVSSEAINLLEQQRTTLGTHWRNPIEGMANVIGQHPILSEDLVLALVRLEAAHGDCLASNLPVPEAIYPSCTELQNMSLIPEGGRFLSPSLRQELYWNASRDTEVILLEELTVASRPRGYADLIIARELIRLIQVGDIAPELHSKVLAALNDPTIINDVWLVDEINSRSVTIPASLPGN